MTRSVRASGGCRRFLASAIALVVALTGCGGDDSSSSAPTTVTTAAASPSGATSTIVTSTSSSTHGRATATTGARATSTTMPAATSTTGATMTTTTASRTPASALGFGEIAFTIGTSGQRCALLAETDQQHARGLMGRSDLAGYDAMIFRFAADTTGAFYMRNVPVGLSIAWFAADGRFVSSTDMAPCGDRPDCPTYGPAGPYRFAIEVLQGGLEPLGATAGSVLTLGGACSP